MTNGNLIMIVGIPGSGKSTFCKELVSSVKDGIILNSDSIRKELFGNEKTQGNPKDIFEIMNNRCKENLSVGKTVIYDATNINSVYRIDLLENMKSYYDQADCYMIKTPIHVVKKRNKKRDRKVPENIIFKMHHNLETPHLDEGFENIYTLDEYFNVINIDSKKNKILQR